MSHLPFERIVAYLAGELPDDAERAVDEHYFGCAACAAAVEEVQTLVGAVAAVIPPVITGERLDRLARGGARIRATDVAPGQDVDVVFDREVDYLLHRLHADLRGAERVDMEIVDGGEVLLRFEAVPVDVTAGVVQIVCQRHFGEMGFADDVRFRLVAVAPESRAVLGEYLVRHRFV
jgi:Putative zinc-finger